MSIGRLESGMKKNKRARCLFEEPGSLIPYESPSIGFTWIYIPRLILQHLIQSCAFRQARLTLRYICQGFGRWMFVDWNCLVILALTILACLFLFFAVIARHVPLQVQDEA